MYPRGRRTLEAVFVLLALALSAMALLPSGALASSNQVVGLVYFGNCQTQTQSGFVANARVTLNDANGVQGPFVVTTGGDGSFSFTPPTGTYWINVTATGYYASQTAIFRFDGSTTLTQDVCMDKQPTANVPVTFQVQDPSANPVGKATVAVYSMPSPTRLVTSGVTNSTTGVVTLTLWGTSGSPAPFQIRTSAVGFQTATTYVNVTGTATFTIPLALGAEIVGHARNSAGQFVSAGLVAWLYNPALSTDSAYRLVPGVVNGSLYDFHVPSGTAYRLIVDANGYTAMTASVTAGTTPNPVDVNLPTAPQALFHTDVVFGPKDWNNFTVFRNLTLNPDSPFPFLAPTNLRDLRLQIDATFGNGDGVLDSTEATAFTNWLTARGPFYLTTGTFLLTNGKAYNATTANRPVVTNLLGTGPVSISYQDNYTLAGGNSRITYGAPTYYVNTTLVPDQSAPEYQNYSFTVQLPDGYEMLSNQIKGSVTVSHYQRVNLDPGVLGSATPQVFMTVVPAKGGIAKAKIVGPVGKFYVVNSTYQNYHAYAANNTTITFSGGDSFNPPSDDATRANYTWRFDANSTCGAACTGYGIQPTYEYTTPGEHLVNLTMLGSGGNVSYRNITIWVDGDYPVPNFRTNLTGSGSAVGQTLRVNQGTMVKFDGGLSTDLAYPGKNGVLLNSGYAWDTNGDGITDGTGRVFNATFSVAGQFTVNLTLTDSVGWKASNVSMTVIVNDTTPPIPSVQVLDPANDYVVVPFTNLFENRTYIFNASKTTDNHDKTTELNYTWLIPGPLIGVQGTNTTRYGMNITFGWSEFNSTYAVKLTVRDLGFPSGKTNNKTIFVNITVQVCAGCRPDTKIDAGSMKIDNTNPEEGQTITVTVNVTNKVKSGPANAIVAVVRELNSNGQELASSTTPVWLDSGGNAITGRSIASGSTVTLRFTLTVVGQGNMTIKVTVRDSKEPFTWVTAENSASMTVVVRQAAWVNYAIIGSVVGVFLVVVGAMYYRRKVRSGDWQPRFRRAKKEKGGEGEEKKPRKEKEVKEEKKRL